MPVYLQYKSIYTDPFAFYANDITVNNTAFEIYKKHVDNGNILSWNKEEFAETLTKVITIEYLDSDAYYSHGDDVRSLASSGDVDWVTNTDYVLLTSI